MLELFLLQALQLQLELTLILIIMLAKKFRFTIPAFEISPYSTLDVATVSDDDSSVDTLSHVEMPESEGEFWPDHQKVPDPSYLVTAPEGDHHQSPMAKF